MTQGEQSDWVWIGNTRVPSTADKHLQVCSELNEIYRAKNLDYGDSFHKTFIEEGYAMPRIRMTDKLERFKKLTRTGGQQVKNESLRDTLLDLANYAIMTVMEMDSAEHAMHDAMVRRGDA